jgi:DNA topoisomerase-1
VALAAVAAPVIEKAEEVLVDSKAAAREAGLRYVNPNGPGIRRLKRGKSFAYIGVDGQPERDPETLARINAIVIPPAWTDVWISPVANGHLQATGRDAKGRKQYRYHARWREVRDEAKYGHTVAFGRALPRIRRKVQADLSLPGLPREKVLAAIVRLLETTLIRVGNEEYARDNNSHGLTTLRDKHVRVNGAKVDFVFVGKSGKQHRIDIKDKRLASIVRRCRDIPGQDLFQYIDDDGERRSVTSSDVNDYLRTISGQEFTAKDFRTWAGTLLAAMALREFEEFDSETQAKRNVVQAIENVAERLGNTPTICRKCYVHPEILEAYMGGELAANLAAKAQTELRGLRGLGAEEAAVLAFLERRLAAAAS